RASRLSPRGTRRGFSEPQDVADGRRRVGEQRAPEGRGLALAAESADQDAEPDAAFAQVDAFHTGRLAESRRETRHFTLGTAARPIGAEVNCEAARFRVY